MNLAPRGSQYGSHGGIVDTKTKMPQHRYGAGAFSFGSFITIYHATEKAVYEDKYYVFG